MLRCTIELLPGGDESRARVIGLVELCNLRTHADGRADYAVVLKKTPPFRGALRDAWKHGRLTGVRVVEEVLTGEESDAVYALVEGHHRTRRGSYDLLYRALRACGLAARNPEEKETE